MKSEQRSLEKIRETFAQRFSFITRIDPEEPAVILPEENVRERKKGSIRYFGNCMIRYVFGEEDGREYLEYYAFDPMGDFHGRIYDDGTAVDLPELPTYYSADPTIPGERERKKAEMQREYREEADDLRRKGLYD